MRTRAKVTSTPGFALPLIPPDSETVARRRANGGASRSSFCSTLLFNPRGHRDLDFRAEAASTQMLISQDLGPTFLYFNNQYHDANTNKGNLFGSSIGR